MAVVEGEWWWWKESGGGGRRVAVVEAEWRHLLTPAIALFWPLTLMALLASVSEA